MNEKKLAIYFLTDNVDIEKEKNEIEFLQEVGRVVVVSTNPKVPKYPGTKRLIIKPLMGKLFYLVVIWSKIAYLLSYIAETSSDKKFSVRNIYSGNIIVRKLINLFWGIKILPFLNVMFPTYDSVYFFPFKFISIFTPKKNQKISLYRKIFVHDSLVFRLNAFPFLVLHARENQYPTIANIKSWDNPFYSQLATNADGFLVWSQSMWNDVIRVHGKGLQNKFYHVWGARPFYKFRMNANHYMEKLPARINRSELVIGYAAAFCDEIMGKHEIALIKEIASKLKASGSHSRIYFRPYPILPTSFYAELELLENVDLVGIKGEAIDYSNDGKVFHKLNLGNDAERLDYLNSCDCFLSIATSFTIEASMFALPIIHFYMKPNEQHEKFEIEFFKRIQISDHIVEYFNSELVLTGSYEELIAKFNSLKLEKDIAINNGQNLLKRMGIFKNQIEWNSSAKTLEYNLLNFGKKKRS